MLPDEFLLIVLYFLFCFLVFTYLVASLLILIPSLFFLLPPYSFFPICISILTLFCLINISPTYICFTLVNMEVLSVSFSVLYPFFPSTHILPCLHIATLSPAVHPRTGIHECRNTACWGLPCAHVPDAVSYKGM